MHLHSDEIVDAVELIHDELAPLIRLINENATRVTVNVLALMIGVSTLAFELLGPLESKGLLCYRHCGRCALCGNRGMKRLSIYAVFLMKMFERLVDRTHNFSFLDLRAMSEALDGCSSACANRLRDDAAANCQYVVNI